MNMYLVLLYDRGEYARALVRANNVDVTAEKALDVIAGGRDPDRRWMVRENSLIPADLSAMEIR